MSKTDKYFQFPISLLAHAKTAEQRMDDTISWCVVDAGTKGLDKLESEDQDNMIDGIINRSKTEFNADDPTHRAVIIGLETLKVTADKVGFLIEQHQRASTFICGMEYKFGTSPFVRIRTNLFWQAVADARAPGTGINWRTFSVLCGVYAILGDKTYMRICRDRIQAAALGYKSVKVMRSHLRSRQDKAKPLTINQLRSTLDRLEADGFFCRVHPSPRRTYFSNRIPREQLSEMVFNRETSRSARLNQNRSNDRQLRDKIRQACEVKK